MSNLWVVDAPESKPSAPMALRDYQQRAVDSIGRCLAASGSTLLVQPTGTGKTVVFAHTIRKICPPDKRALVIAHRQELIHQAARTIGAITGEPCAIEMAERHADLPGTRKARVVVASKDTLHAKRLRRFDPGDFGIVITDECFPAGTLVDGRPIETIAIDDEVSCYDHSSGLCVRRVSGLFKRRPAAMVKVFLSDGAAIICTPCHPIWSETRGRYVGAADLGRNDMVSRLTTYAQANLPRLWNAIRAFAAQAKENLLRGMPEQGRVGNDGADQPSLCVGAHDKTKPDAVRVGATTSFRNHAGEGVSSDPSWRQRNWSDRAGATTSGSVGMDNRPGGPNPHAETEQRTSAVALQDRRGQRGHENRSGSRWRIAQVADQKGPGPEEGRFFEAVRVDRVEVLERGRDGTFGGMCPGGFVYNLEVEQHHNYFANGILVHNCHHATANSYQDIYNYFKGVPHLGVTATPDRHDEEALGQIYNSVAMVYEIADAIDDGWLVPITARTAFIHGLELAGCRTTAGDLNASDLAAQLEQEKPLHKMAATMHELAEGRRAIVFTATVRQAAMMAEVLNDYEPDSARWVCGETPRDQRDSDLKAHRAGEYRWMLNCGIATEGYDDPTCDMIVIARPTKSRSLFAQMLGRGTRPAPGCVDGIGTPGERRAAIASSSKPGCFVLDFVGNCGRHKLVGPADVLGGNYSDEDIEAASYAIRNGDVAVCDALEDARRAREARADAEAAEKEAVRLARNRARIMATAKFLLQEVDLFGDSDGHHHGRERGWDVVRGKEPTQAQIDTLAKAGFADEDVRTLNRSQCSKLIGEIIMRRQLGLCTIKQARLLAKFGVDASRMSFEEAGAMIGRKLGR